MGLITIHSPMNMLALGLDPSSSISSPFVLKFPSFDTFNLFNSERYDNVSLSFDEGFSNLVSRLCPDKVPFKAIAGDPDPLNVGDTKEWIMSPSIIDSIFPTELSVLTNLMFDSAIMMQSVEAPDSQELKYQDLFSSPVVAEAVGWLEKDVDHEFYRALNDSQGVRILDSKRFKDPHYNNEFHRNSKIMEIFKIVVYGLEQNLFVNRDEAYVFLRDAVVPLMTLQARQSYAKEFEMLVPWAFELVGNPWIKTTLPEKLNDTNLNPSSEFERTKTNLVKIGFQRIGNSSFFERGDFVVCVGQDGQPTVYSDFKRFNEARDIRAINIKDRYGKDVVQLYGVSDGRAWANYEGMSGSGPIDDVQKEFSSVLSKTIIDQLLEAGFQEDQVDKGIFRKTICNSNNDDREFVAFVNGNVIQRLIVSGIKVVQDRLTPDTVFIKYGVHKDILSPMPALIFRTGDVEITATSFGVQDQRNLSSLENMTHEQLGIELFVPRQDDTTGFVYGGTNPTENIRRLSEIHGIPIKELERRMRPRQLSEAGFLGPEESLLDVMAMDNDWVTQNNLSHQKIAETLHFIRALALNKLDGKEIVFHDRRYQVDSVFFMGGQVSPFEQLDSVRFSPAPHAYGSFDLRVKNLATGDSISFSSLLPFFIERYGFYEGTGTPYRVSPQKICEVFDFLNGN